MNDKIISIIVSLCFLNSVILLRLFSNMIDINKKLELLSIENKKLNDILSEMVDK